MQKKKLKINDNGITLIALIITIIVLLILAGVSISVLIGDNGMITQMKSAKTKHEDESAKEELQLAWAARMSKFYEDTSRGETISMAEYFSGNNAKRELNAILGNKGKFTLIKFIETDDSSYFEATYISSNDISYKAKISLAGEILELLRVENSLEYTEVWANYYKNGSNASLIYNTYKDEAALYSWDITEPISNANSVPWNTTYSVYGVINYVKVEDDVLPENTQFMFYNLLKVTEIDGLYELFCRTNEIGEKCFCYCRKLENITMSDSITSIKKNAFQYCDALTNITLSNNLNTIAERTFAGCKSLERITIPNGVISIGENVFDYCEKLVEVIIPGSVTSIGKEAFHSCSTLESLVIPNSVTIIGEAAFSYCSNLSNLVISNNITKMEDNLFYACGKLESITIPNNVTCIGGYVFFCCTNLTSIIIPNNVETIGENAFYGCSNLTTIRIEKVENSISGKPWGAPKGSGIIIWG